MGQHCQSATYAVDDGRRVAESSASRHQNVERKAGAIFGAPDGLHDNDNEALNGSVGTTTTVFHLDGAALCGQ